MYNKLKSLVLQARKDRDKDLVKFLTTVQGDIQRDAEKAGCKENPIDAVVIATYKAYQKRYKTEKEEGRLTVGQAIEWGALNLLLPKEASEDEILAVIKENDPQSMKDMGKIMGILKAKFDNFDGGLASGLVKNYITGG